MNEFDLNDDILVDRLVDGELSAGERRLLIASLDSRPDGWRRCALAFLEAQAWKQELGELAGEASRSPVTTHAAVSQPVRRQSLNWLVLAATVLIASTLGLALRYLSHPHLFATPGPSTTDIAQSDAADAAASQDALTMWVSDDSGRPQQLKVPLLDANLVDEHLGTQFQSGLPASVRDQLIDSGYRVESKRRYAPFLLSNGQPLVVPVEDTKIVPNSNVVY